MTQKKKKMVILEKNPSCFENSCRPTRWSGTNHRSANLSQNSQNKERNKRYPLSFIPPHGHEYYVGTAQVTNYLGHVYPQQNVQISNCWKEKGL